MSIVVKGMKMPITCQKCRIDATFCDLWQFCDKDIIRHPDCPLAEFPEKHGRLIDADDAMVTLSSALEKAIREENDATAFTIGAIEGFLKASPTVIEAEEQE